MEGWKDGRMEGWKDGRMEGWKIGWKIGYRSSTLPLDMNWFIGIMTTWKNGDTSSNLPPFQSSIG